MTHHPEPQPPLIAVMTSRDAKLIYDVLRDAAGGQRRNMPPGVNGVEDLQAIMRGGVAFFVAFEGDQPVGAIGYRWERTTLRIFHVAVKPAYQRRGVAARLVQAVESVGFALGTTNVSVELGKENAQSFPFERFGYAHSRPDGRHDAGRTMIRKALGER